MPRRGRKHRKAFNKDETCYGIGTIVFTAGLACGVKKLHKGTAGRTGELAMEEEEEEQPQE